MVNASANAGWVGAAVAVLEGEGQGQVRRVRAATGRTYTTDRPWDVALDASSLISINPYVGKVLMQGNRIRNATTIQIFGSGFDSVYAGNILEHMYSTKVVHPGGMIMFALDYQGYQPNVSNIYLSARSPVSATEGESYLILSPCMHVCTYSSHSVCQRQYQGRYIKKGTYYTF